jgi:hypothetical protein
MQAAKMLPAVLVDDLIRQLGDRRWEVRDRASTSLKMGGRELFDQLASAYQASRSPEVRLRIKEVVEHVWLSGELKPTGGFLGVRQRLVTPADDPRIPQGQAGIQVIEAIPGTAAQQAGLVPGDVILTLNGKPLRADDRAEDFAGRIFALQQGAKVSLTVLRGAKQIEVQATLGPRPLELGDLRAGDPSRSLAQRRFWAMWRAKFDPNDQNLNSADAGQPEIVWPDHLPDLRGGEAEPGE